LLAYHTRCGALGKGQTVAALGGRIRTAVASSSASSHRSAAQSTAAPGRAGTSHMTRDESETVIDDQRVVPAGVAATATRTSRRSGSTPPVLGRTAPPAFAGAGTRREAKAAAATTRHRGESRGRTS